jgi:hypothetical protein
VVVAGHLRPRFYVAYIGDPARQIAKVHPPHARPQTVTRAHAGQVRPKSATGSNTANGMAGGAALLKKNAPPVQRGRGGGVTRPGLRSQMSNSAPGKATISNAINGCDSPQNSAHWPRNRSAWVDGHGQFIDPTGHPIHLARDRRHPERMYHIGRRQALGHARHNPMTMRPAVQYHASLTVVRDLIDSSKAGPPAADDHDIFLGKRALSHLATPSPPE